LQNLNLDLLGVQCGRNEFVTAPRVTRDRTTVERAVGCSTNGSYDEFGPCCGQLFRVDHRRGARISWHRLCDRRVRNVPHRCLATAHLCFGTQGEPRHAISTYSRLRGCCHGGDRSSSLTLVTPRN